MLTELNRLDLEQQSHIQLKTIKEKEDKIKRMDLQISQLQQQIETNMIFPPNDKIILVVPACVTSGFHSTTPGLSIQYLIETRFLIIDVRIQIQS